MTNTTTSNRSENVVKSIPRTIISIPVLGAQTSPRSEMIWVCEWFRM